MDEIPPPRDLQQVTLTGQLPPLMSRSELPLTICGPHRSCYLDNFTASLVSPVPTLLIEKIKTGSSMDMSEFLSYHMRVLDNGDHPSQSSINNAMLSTYWSGHAGLHYTLPS